MKQQSQIFLDCLIIFYSSSNVSLVFVCLFGPCFSQQRNTIYLSTPSTPNTTRIRRPQSTAIMCYQVVERHSVCRCLHYRHAVDPCSAYGQRGHYVQEKTVLVGYVCPAHSPRRRDAYSSSSGAGQPDSGYSSGGYGSSRYR